MGDVVSLEVDGNPVGPQLERSRTRPAWGMPAAVLLVGALVLGVGWSLIRGGDAPSSATNPAVTTPTTQRQAPSTSDAPLVVGGAPTTAPAAPVIGLGPVEAARAALTAWGEFASSGDLSLVRATFAADGPQLRQLEQESARVEPGAAGGDYRVALTETTADVGGITATVIGTVTWSRASEADQIYRWAIELRFVDDAWRLFTVRTVEG